MSDGFRSTIAKETGVILATIGAWGFVPHNSWFGRGFVTSTDMGAAVSLAGMSRGTKAPIVKAKATRVDA
jgi:hypothetical protein